MKHQDTDTLSELEQRISQANALVSSHKTYQRPLNGGALSRARFLNTEIASLTAIPGGKAETRSANPPSVSLNESELRDVAEAEANDRFPLFPSGGNRVAEFSYLLRGAQEALASEKRAEMREVLEMRVSHYIAELRREKHVREQLSAGVRAEELGFRIVRDDTSDVSRTNRVAVASGAGRSYRSLFGQPDGEREWKSLAEMGSVILSGRSEPRLSRAAHGANTLIGGDGGFLVPENLVVQLFDSALEQSIVMSRADVVALLHGNRLVAGFDESNRVNGSVYGFVSDWINEGETMSLSKPKFRQFMLKARKLAIFTAVTNELLSDALESGSGIEQAMARAIGFSLDRALLVAGNGTSQPMSLLNSPSKITVAKESGQAGGTILYRNLSNMSAKLAPEFDKNAIWIASPSTKVQLAETSIELIDGVQMAHVPVLSQQGGKSYILGREVVWSEHLPTVGTEGDIILADLSAYAVGIAKEITIDRSSHVYFASDETAFRSIIRVDAASKLATTITASNGATLSWAVTLATRA